MKLILGISSHIPLFWPFVKTKSGHEG